MSKVCELLREALKDEKKAVPEYNTLKAKMLGHKKNKSTIDKIIDDEKSHHEKLLKIAEELGCNCNK